MVDTNPTTEATGQSRRDYLKSVGSAAVALTATTGSVSAGESDTIVLPIGKEVPSSDVIKTGTRGQADEVRPDFLPDLEQVRAEEAARSQSSSDPSGVRESSTASSSSQHEDSVTISQDFNGWAGSTSYWHDDGSHITNIYSRWDVPSEPENENTDATHFFFPGLQNDGDPHSILQPVLEWNNGTGKEWIMRSWRVGDQTENSPHISVSPGDTLEGFVYMQGSDNTSDEWMIGGTNLDTNETVQLTTPALDSRGEFRQAVTAFETYDFPEGDCDKLPGGVTFRKLQMLDDHDDVSENWGVWHEEDIGCSLSVSYSNSANETYIYP
ncbi:hypothetical protein [Halorussus pelagicus]|uniref:hypothetical protein n=1 Tax=Halorussus pelagicus TaxID=2505977 RepID=UPI000FFB2588|nr:hypothetical protein [Halorussus pelagicus]